MGMGVHSLGKASVQNSGYSGWWTDESNVASFNNNYYISIVNKGWGPTPVGANSKPQWERRGSKHDDEHDEHPEMMLNTDMCLVSRPTVALGRDSLLCKIWVFRTLLTGHRFT